jgi:hypothetical protein
LNITISGIAERPVALVACHYRSHLSIGSSQLWCIFRTNQKR